MPDTPLISHTILRATPSDLPLARQAVTQVHDRPESPALADFLADPACYLLIAISAENKAIGSLNGYALRKPDRPEPQFLLYEIDVLPEFHNRGVGKSLCRAFIAEATAAGGYVAWVVTNESTPAAKAMYAASGFKRRNPDDVMMEIYFPNSSC